VDKILLFNFESNTTEDIKTTLDSKGYGISEKTIYNILSEKGVLKSNFQEQPILKYVFYMP